MEPKREERFTNFAIAAAVFAGVGVIAVRPEFALLVLAGAEAIAAAGCAMMVRTTLRRAPPAQVAAVILAVFSLFWMGMAALSVMWYLERQP